MRGLGTALQAAQQGIATAHAQAASAAEEVVRGTTFQVAPDTVKLSGASPPDVTRGLVDLRVARYQQAASVAVFETVDEMSEELNRL